MVFLGVVFGVSRTACVRTYIIWLGANLELSTDLSYGCYVASGFIYGSCRYRTLLAQRKVRSKPVIFAFFLAIVILCNQCIYATNVPRKLFERLVLAINVLWCVRPTFCWVWTWSRPGSVNYVVAYPMPQSIALARTGAESEMSECLIWEHVWQDACVSIIWSTLVCRPPVLVLDGLGAAQNIGQILRTAFHLGSLAWRNTLKTMGCVWLFGAKRQRETVWMTRSSNQLNHLGFKLVFVCVWQKFQPCFCLISSQLQVYRM